MLIRWLKDRRLRRLLYQSEALQPILTVKHMLGLEKLVIADASQCAEFLAWIRDKLVAAGLPWDTAGLNLAWKKGVITERDLTTVIANTGTMLMHGV